MRSKKELENILLNYISYSDLIKGKKYFKPYIEYKGKIKND